jgi:hypothetical protein
LPLRVELSVAVHSPDEKELPAALLNLQLLTWNE